VKTKKTNQVTVFCCKGNQYINITMISMITFTRSRLLPTSGNSSQAYYAVVL